MPITIPPANERPDYYSTAEFGELFGRSRQWATRLILDEKITFVRIGVGRGKQYIPSSQIDALLATGAGN